MCYCWYCYCNNHLLAVNSSNKETYILVSTRKVERGGVLNRRTVCGLPVDYCKGFKQKMNSSFL